jgi:hypothetical protein
LNKITDLKSASKGETRKKKLQGGKAKIAYFAGGKDLFTLFYYY